MNSVRLASEYDWKNTKNIAMSSLFRVAILTPRNGAL